jgi:hypothetical protein
VFETGLQERVRRVVLHRIRDIHTILADQWRHECDANISIIARDLSSARFIGARSASACIVTHRRAGKTVACIHEFQRRAVESTKKHPRFAYLSPLLKQSKTVAWDYLRDAMPLLRKAGATVNETELKEKGPVVLADAGDVAKVGLGHVVAADRISSQPAFSSTICLQVAKLPHF